MSDSARSKTLVVLPNDPLERYAAKGEVKVRYLNPGDFFDRVHVISLADTDDAAEAARVMAGRAEVRIHPVGRPGPLNFSRVTGRARKLVSEIKPHVVRGFNPLLMGWLAVKLARHCGASSVVSVHADYHPWRNLRIHGPRFLLSARGMYQAVHSALGMNRTSLGGADHVICAYRFPVEHVHRWRQDGISVIYNRVDLARFQPGTRQAEAGNGPLRILTVGRQFEGKDPEPLLRAVAAFGDSELTLVGDGPQHERLRELARSLEIGQRVVFIPRVEHENLPELYRTHDVFAINITHPGVCIPVLEAAASGLPVVIYRPLWEAEPEVVGELAEIVEADAGSYAAAFQRLYSDSDFRALRGKQLRDRVAQIDTAATEGQETEIYRQLDERCSAKRADRG